MITITGNSNAINGLKDIRDNVQHVVSAISAALGAEVAVVDTDFELVATSKTFLETRGTNINEKFIRGIYRKGMAVITNPGHHELCKGCYYEGNCPETAEVLRVIEQDGKRYGVLLMVAYTQTQKEKFLSNTGELLEFIGEMANLICDEIRLQKSLEEEKYIKRQLETTINFVDDGIITIDHQGHITQINNKAKNILGIVANRMTTNLNIRNYLPEQLLYPLIREGKKIKRCEIQIVKPRKLHCMVSANPVAVAQKLMGAVLRVQDFKELRSEVYEISAKHIETTFDDIQGVSDMLLQVKTHAMTIAHNDSTVLILGESGTGKELFARAIHTESRRKKDPFIAINCAAIPEALLESELFGYDEGAFSGARKGGKPGKFELADGGTLFLDEIGEMPLHMQVKLLRVLQEGTVERVGGVTSLSVNVRIITATNVKLEQLVNNGGFREDLYYRLNVVPIEIPPLRRRKQDIPVLASHFLKKYSQAMNSGIEAFSSVVLDIFVDYHWPGNVRELQNAIEYAVNMETSSIIEHGSLPPAIPRLNAGGKTTRQSLADKVRAYERMIINEALIAFPDSGEGKKLAAKELGVSLPTLYRKIKEHKIAALGT